MIINGVNIVIEECVSSYSITSSELCRYEGHALVKVYRNDKTRRYRAICNLYFASSETGERFVFEVRDCAFEDEALTKLYLKYATFYKDNDTRLFPSKSADLKEKYLPYWKF